MLTRLPTFRQGARKAETRLALSVIAALLVVSLLGAAWPRALQAQDGAATGTVDSTIPRLNVRSEPSAGAGIVAKLPAGSTVTILDADESGQWLRVTAETLTGEGWVAAAFVQAGAAAAVASATPRATASASTAPSSSSALAGAASGSTRRVLPARPTATATGALTSSETLALPTPTPTGTAGVGAEVAAAATVAPTAAPTAAPTVAPTAAPTAAPAAAPAAALAAAPAAASSTAVTSTAAASTASPSTTPDNASAETGTADTGAADAEDAAEPETPTAYVVPATMNVRGGPGTAYARVGAAAQGTALAITGVTPAGDWYRIEQADGSEGWVSAGLVTTAGPMANVKQLADDEIPTPPVAQAAPASGSPASAAPASVAAAPAPSGGGGFAYGVTANMWQSDKAGVANALTDLGFPWVKQQVRWEFVETSPGAVNWQEMDGIVNTMNGYGHNLAFSVVTAPSWTRPTKGGTNGPPEDFNTFANFLGQIAGRYCGQSLKAIEVWNEQNLQREWEGYPLDPALYMDLLKRAYTSIKAACPSMIVVSGAPTPAGYSAVAFDDIDYLRGMYQNGLARYADAVGIHPSGFANPPSVRFSDWQSGAYTALSHADHRSFYFLSTLEESRAVMVQFGDAAKKLWPTEFGWGSTSSPHPGYEYQARISEGQQAQWIVDAFRIMANSGYVGAAFLWNLNYNYGEMQTFSVLGRPAYDALKQLTGR